MFENYQYYHVYNRGAHKRKIFLTNFHYSYFLDLLEKYRSKYKVNVFAYCLMPNHFHFLLQQNEGGSIARFLQTTFNAYVQAFNKMENHSGTILEGAAKRILVDNDEYAVRVTAYIHENPVLAHLVTNADNWTYSDCREWMGKKPFRFEGKILLDYYFSNSGEYEDFLKLCLKEKIEQKMEKYLFD